MVVWERLPGDQGWMHRAKNQVVNRTPDSRMVCPLADILEVAKMKTFTQPVLCAPS